MTPKAQNVAIAKACGWSRFGMYRHIASGKQLLGGPETLHGTPPRDNDKPQDDQAYEPVPNYVADLGAVAKAQATLTDEQRTAFTYHLLGVLFQDTPIESLNNNPGVVKVIWDVANATAAQRAEAFLRTLGLWEGGQP
jgi:hypothetical protein